MLTRAEEEQEESWLPKKSEQLLGWYRVAAPPCLHPPLPLRTGSIPFCTTPPFFFPLLFHPPLASPALEGGSVHPGLLQC